MQIHSSCFLLVILLASVLAELSPLPLLRINLRNDFIQEAKRDNLYCTDLISVEIKISMCTVKQVLGLSFISECYHATTLYLLSKYWSHYQHVHFHSLCNIYTKRCKDWAYCITDEQRKFFIFRLIENFLYWAIKRSNFQEAIQSTNLQTFTNK